MLSHKANICCCFMRQMWLPLLETSVTVTWGKFYWLLLHDANIGCRDMHRLCYYMWYMQLLFEANVAVLWGKRCCYIRLIDPRIRLLLQEANVRCCYMRQFVSCCYMRQMFLFYEANVAGKCWLLGHSHHWKRRWLADVGDCSVLINGDLITWLWAL